MKFSYSALSAYLTCPRKYAYQTEGYKGVIHHSAKFGLLVHQVLETAEDFKKETIKKSLEDRFYNSNLPLIYESLLEPIVTNVTKFCNYTIISQEKKFIFPFGEDNFVARIDLILRDSVGNCEVVDFKTGRFLTPLTYFNLPSKFDGSKDSLQLSIYYLAVPKATKYSTYYLRSGNSFSLTRDFLLKRKLLISNYLTSIISKIKEDTNFLRRPNFLCGYCEFKYLCSGRID